MLADKYNMDYVMEDEWSGLGGGSRSSSSSGDGGPTSKVRASFVRTSRRSKNESPGGVDYGWMAEARSQGASIPQSIWQNPEKKEGLRYVDEVSLMGTSVGEGVPSKPKYIGGKHMIPTHVFEDADGKLYVRGKLAKQPGTKYVDGKAEGPYSMEEIGVTETPDGDYIYSNFEYLKDAVVPVAAYAGDVYNAIGINPSSLRTIIREKQSGDNQTMGFDEAGD
jgi:hypothetical protein